MALNQPYAVFDIDGTLIRWQLYHALADELASKGIIDAKKYKAVITERHNWQIRRSPTSFTDYELSLVKLINLSIPGVDYQVFSNACEGVVNHYKDRVYTYTRDLIAELRQQHFLTFAISASPTEVVSLVADYYGFDDYAASTYEVVRGKLTGNKHVLLGSAKTIQLNKLIKKHDASEPGSIGVGDSEGDIGFLEHVERAIAFNPSLTLYNHAASKGWEVVVERKNVVYNLRRDNGNYLLAPTVNRQTLIF